MIKPFSLLCTTHFSLVYPLETSTASVFNLICISPYSARYPLETSTASFYKAYASVFPVFLCIFVLLSGASSLNLSVYPPKTTYASGFSGFLCIPQHIFLCCTLVLNANFFVLSVSLCDAMLLLSFCYA